MTGNPSNRESDDNYCRVIVAFANYRLIDGSCGIQWVIQKRDGNRKDGALRWTGHSYTRRRETVLRLYRELCAVADPNVLGILESLPDWHPRWGANA
jgi:hypothetical protein